MKTKLLRLSFIYIAIACLCGCASRLVEYRPWNDRTVYKSDPGESATNNTYKARIALRDAYETYSESNPYRGSNFILSELEFDDQGEMWDRQQLDGALELIKEYRRSSYPITLIVFVHGWKHDASSYSSNLVNFRGFIQEYAKYVSEPHEL